MEFMEKDWKGINQNCNSGCFWLMGEIMGDTYLLFGLS